MSWSSIYPLLTEEDNEKYFESATSIEKHAIDEVLRIGETIAPSDNADLVVTCLFGAAPLAGFELATRGRLSHEYQVRWEIFVEGKLRHWRAMQKEGRRAGLRVYLASYLSFLVDKLARNGVEVMIMARDGSNFGLPGFWPLLALHEPGRTITFLKMANFEMLPLAVGRTEAMAASGLGMWREPRSADFDTPNPFYFPVAASAFGAISGFFDSTSLKAFIWRTMKGLLDCRISWPGMQSVRDPFPLDWRTRNIDEWALATSVYPRYAQTGVLTFSDCKSKPPIFGFDVEYVTWANPDSQLIYIPQGNKKHLT